MTLHILTFHCLFAQENDNTSQKKIETIISEVKKSIENNDLTQAEYLIEILFGKIKLENHLDNVVPLLSQMFKGIQNSNNFYMSKMAREYVLNSCSLSSIDINSVCSQVDLLLFYIYKVNWKNLEKNKLKELRKQDISLLLSLWKKLENAANIDENEIKLPKSFWEDGLYMNEDLVFFEDKVAEEKYKKYSEELAKVFQKRNEKKNAFETMKQRKDVVINIIVSLYSFPPHEKKEIESLFEKYKIDNDISKKVLAQIK
ncbi:MAG: hypothetical protein LBE12_15295 [Planctomycetaceae bacterium]|jgi:hypothetical protein|nr:hypothetical protein [Planctomycetaceae bacterium]